jgi:hypothetical protein
MARNYAVIRLPASSDLHRVSKTGFLRHVSRPILYARLNLSVPLT